MEPIETNFSLVEFRDGCVFKKPKPDSSEFILKEYRILNSIGKHPNVIGLLGFDYENNIPRLRLEFGGNALIDIVPIDPSVAESIYRQLMEGVAFLHGHNVVHLDLKPDNVLYNEGRVRIIDLGLAKMVKDSDRHCNFVRSPVGSASYCCPEALDGKTYNGFEADFWSIGVIAFALGSGHLPWKAASVRCRLFLAFVQSGLLASVFFSCMRLPLWAARAVDSMLLVDSMRRGTVWFPPRKIEKKILTTFQEC